MNQIPKEVEFFFSRIFQSSKIIVPVDIAALIE